jgi:two-component system cell cycle response regulator
MRELKAGYGPAKTAYDHLRASGTLDKPHLDTLRKFFHKLAGSAAAADLAVLGKLAGLCETATDAMIAGKFSAGRHALQLLGDALNAVRAILDARGRTETPLSVRPVTPVLPAVVEVRIPEGAPRVLVVDDDPLSARIAENVLLSAGLAATACTDAQESLRLMRERVPDLVLLDVEMPKLDGFEVCAQMRKDSSLHLVPVVFVTQHGEVEKRVRGLSVGGSDYVQKPFEPQELVARIRAHLSNAGKYRELAIRDGLTGCYNSDYFKARIEQEMARARRYKSRLVLGLLDVDGLKRVNDAYGHRAGDAVLSKLSSILAGALRSSDVLARYAGDEFAFLLLEASIADSMAACNRLRESIARTAFELPETASGKLKVTTTVSIGLAAYRDGDSVHDFLLRADGVLFEAKEQGRNRVLMG